MFLDVTNSLTNPNVFLQVRVQENPENVHHHLLHDLLVLMRRGLPHDNRLVQDDQLHVVVAILDNELDVGGGCGLDGGGSAEQIMAWHGI